MFAPCEPAHSRQSRYPFDLPCRGGRDAEKHHSGHANRMLFGVSERQGRSPGPSKSYNRMRIKGYVNRLEKQFSEVFDVLLPPYEAFAGK